MLEAKFCVPGPMTNRWRWRLPQVEAGEKLLTRLGGILMTNAFEARVRRLGSHVRCLFPDAGLLAHSCLPNVHHTIDHNFTIFLRAAEPVKQVSGVPECGRHTRQGHGQTGQ